SKARGLRAVCGGHDPVWLRGIARALDWTRSARVHDRDADSSNRRARLHIGDGLSRRGHSGASTNARRMVPLSGGAWSHVVARIVSARSACAGAHSLPDMTRDGAAMAAPQIVPN